MNLNKVILIGRISQKPTISKSKSGFNYVRFNVAVSRDVQQNNDEITDFIPLVAFGNNASFIDRFFNKGDLVSIVGSIQMSQYTTKSGDSAVSSSVLIEQIKSLEPLSVTQERLEKNSLNDDSNFELTINQSNVLQNETNKSSFNEEKTKKDEDNDNPWELDL